jgi:hypothetical protein
MALLLAVAVIAKLLAATTTDISKLFARKALNLLHITIFTSTLSSIHNRHRFGKGTIIRHDSLGNQTLFLPEKFANTSIQRRNVVPI